MTFEKIADPLDAPNFNRTMPELQAFLMFAIAIAGKKSKIQSEKLARFLSYMPMGTINPFDYLWDLSRSALIEDELRYVKMGKYSLITKAFTYLGSNRNNLDLKTVSVSELMEIPGVGLKTAKFFVMFSRETEAHAVLDAHNLDWLRQIGIANVPKNTPSNASTYARLERAFIDAIEATDYYEDQSLPKRLAFADFSIWLHKSNGDQLPPELDPLVVYMAMPLDYEHFAPEFQTSLV